MNIIINCMGTTIESLPQERSINEVKETRKKNPLRLPDPIVSVIIMFRRGGHYLDEALQSLRGQTFKDWEAVIVCSTEDGNISETIEKYSSVDSRFRSYPSKGHTLSEIINYGASLSHGDYLLILDSEDVLAPDYLQHCVQVMREDREAVAALSFIEYFGEEKRDVMVEYRNYPSLLVNNPFPLSSMVRRSDFERIGGFDEKMKFGGEAWDFWIRLFDGKSVENIHIIPEIKFFNRHNGKKKCGGGGMASEDAQKCRNYIYDKHRDKYIHYYGNLVKPWMLQSCENQCFITPLRKFDCVEDENDSHVSLDHLLKLVRELSRHKEFSSSQKKELLSGYAHRWKNQIQEQKGSMSLRTRVKCSLLAKNPSLLLTLQRLFN